MIKTDDYPLATKRGPQGWDYLITLAQFQGPRLSYVAYCVERVIYGQD